MRAIRVRDALWLAVLLALSPLTATRAHASIEEFQSFDISLQEEDDENLLDHHLTRMPQQWPAEWDTSAAGFRTAQGCLTAGQWFMITDFKSSAPLGKRARLDIGYHDVQDNEAKYGWLQLEFRYPLGQHTLGWRFRPTYEKSRHDFALLYDWGNGKSPLQLQAVLTLEDMFNTLWEFRQSRVGNRSEPYRKHPFEPEVRLISRGARHWVEAHALWLTSSEKQVLEPNLVLERTLTLWGAKGGVDASVTRGAWTAEARFDQVQALSTDTPADRSEDARVYRRRWVTEVALRRALSHGMTAEARWVYQDRAQDWHPPLGAGSLRAIDRMPVAELTWQARPTLLARLGTMYDQVGIAKEGLLPDFTWGTRKESRLFLGLQARFGRVLVQGIEGVELDHESYEVSFHHDKGFLQLQTTF